MRNKGGQPSERWTAERRRRQSEVTRHARAKVPRGLRGPLQRAAFSITDDEYMEALGAIGVEDFIRRMGIYARMSKRAFTEFAGEAGVDARLVPGVRARLRQEFEMEEVTYDEKK